MVGIFIGTCLCILTIALIISNSINAKKMVEYHKTKKELEGIIYNLTVQRKQQENEVKDLDNKRSGLMQEIKYNQGLIEAKKDQYAQMEIAEQATRDKLAQERDIWFEKYKQNQEEELKKAAFELYCKQIILPAVLEGFNAEAAVKLDIGAQIAEQVAQLKRTAAAAVEIAKHREEEKNLLDYYRLNLSADALADMAKLRDIMPELKQPEVLGKLIWKVYLEKAYSDLCGRLFGDKTRVTGIYKITNLKNEMCYVGQAVNVIDRWKQHIKRAVGAETPIQNKLYPAMMEFGIENFTFELIEEVPDRLKLDEREDYWQDFYRAKEFGYSIK